MKTLFSSWYVGGAALLAVSASLAACSAEGSDDDGPNGGGEPTGEFAENGSAVQLCTGSAQGSPVLRRLAARELTATLNDVFPEVTGQWSSSLSADPVSHYGYDNDSNRLIVSRQTAREIDQTAASLAAAVAEPAVLGQILPCSTAGADRACAGEFVAKYGRRLYRRPPTAAETERLLTFFDEAAGKTPFPQAIGWIVRALVQSPATLYRRELGALADGSRKLDQYELATALAYTFGGTTPSDVLLDMAANEELSSGEKLVEAARSILLSPRGRENLHTMFAAWLEYARVSTRTKSNVENFETLRDQMREETRRFLDAVVIDGGGGLDELLTSPTTNPSAELAAFYGFPAPAADYASVQRPETAGIGVLAQGSVLSAGATSSFSSPTQRGLLVLERFLCRTPPIVPPTVPDLPPAVEGQTTTRKRYEELHAAGSCKTCHDQFDPIGFGFEHFDEVGRYRADEGGLTVDSSSYVPSGSGSLFDFEGQADLAAGLAAEAEVQACVSAQLKIFAFGVETACLGETERKQFMSGALGFVDYLASLAAEPHFVSRLPE